MKWVLFVERGAVPMTDDMLVQAARRLPGDPVIINRIVAESGSFSPVSPDAPDAVIELTTNDESMEQADYEALLAILWDAGVPVYGGLATDEVPQINRVSRPWANGEEAQDAKEIFFPRRKEGLTREEFKSHWRNVHAPLCHIHHRGMSRYVQHVAARHFGSVDPTIDALATVHCPDRENWQQAMLPDKAAEDAILGDIASFVGGVDAYQVREIVVKSAPRYAMIG